MERTRLVPHLERTPERRTRPRPRADRAIQLERRRHLSGWSGHGIDTFGVTAVTAKDELGRACAELAAGQPSAYVTMRVSEGGDGHDADRARSLRQIIEAEGYISRPPTAGEREALETGLDAMGIPRAAYEPPRRSKDGQG